MKVKIKDDNYYRLTISRERVERVYINLEETNVSEIREMFYKFFPTLTDDGTYKKRISVNIKKKNENTYDNVGNVSVRCNLTTEQFRDELVKFINNLNE